VDLQRRFVFAATPPGALATHRISPSSSRSREHPNRANVRFLIDNAGLPADCESYERLVLVFNGDVPTRSQPRARTGPRCKRGDSRSPIGKAPMSTAAAAEKAIAI